MAKLSAHGAEYARVIAVKRFNPDSLPAFIRADSKVIAYEYHYSFRSDGHILKRTVIVHNDEVPAYRRRNDYGWKLWQRLVEHSRDRDSMLRAADRVAANLTKKDLEVKVVIS